MTRKTSSKQKLKELTDKVIKCIHSTIDLTLTKTKEQGKT